MPYETMNAGLLFTVDDPKYEPPEEIVGTGGVGEEEWFILNLQPI